MQKWLNEEKVLLLRSPPGSGKTSFAVQFAVYLNDQGVTSYYLNASRHVDRLNSDASMNTVWGEQFGFTFKEILLRSRDIPIYVIIDEAQAWYPGKVFREDANREIDLFWGWIKGLQEGQEWTSFIRELTLHASKSTAVAESAINLRLLFLAGYGEKNLGSIATPVQFVDPKDPTTQQRLPLGLNFLRLDREKTCELISKYVVIQNKLGKRISFGDQNVVHKLIFDDTNGHVGVIRTFLHHAIGSDITTIEDLFRFTSHTIYQSDLRGYRTFLSVDADRITKLAPHDLVLLIRCLVLYKQGHRDFPVEALEAVGMVKLGIFVKTDVTTTTGQMTLAFPSPVHFDLALYNVLHRKVALQQNLESFESTLKEMVLRMSPKLLQDTTPNGHKPYERQWQDECCKSLTLMTSKVVKTDVGREFNQRAYLDLYVNDGLQWGIELIRRGGGKKLEEHVGRFSQNNGRYCNIPMKRYAVLNFTDKVPDQTTLDMYDNVWHLVHNATYTNVAVHRQKHVPEDWDLIGYQGRTQF